MKQYIIIIVWMLTLLGCGMQKSANNEELSEKPAGGNEQVDPADMQPKGAMYIEGIVRDKSRDGCGYIIETVSKSGGTTYLQPLSIPQEYAEDGQRIKINYRYSRRPMTCEIGQLIIIDSVVE